MLIKATTYVRGDEPALALSEVTRDAPKDDGTIGSFRFQIIRVWRDDSLWEYTERLGKAGKRRYDPILIVGGFHYGDKVYIEHTVNELKELADDMRAHPIFDKRELAQLNKVRI